MPFSTSTQWGQHLPNGAPWGGGEGSASLSGYMEDRVTLCLVSQDCTGAKCPDPRKMERNRRAWGETALVLQDQLILFKGPKLTSPLCRNLRQTPLTPPAAPVLGLTPAEIPFDP